MEESYTASPVSEGVGETYRAPPLPNPNKQKHDGRSASGGGVIHVPDRDYDDEDVDDSSTGISTSVNGSLQQPLPQQQPLYQPALRYAHNHPHINGTANLHFPGPPSLSIGHSSAIGNRHKNDDDDEFGDGKYPRDSYSFLALHGPFHRPLFFSFGLMAFGFQFAFLALMILSVFDQSSGEFGDDIDNPGTGLASSVFPSNVAQLVRVTQITSMLSFLVFADSTLLDLARAVELMPPFWRKSNNYNNNNNGKDATTTSDWSIFFACFLRFVQGLMAVFAVFLLVMTSSSVIDIVLNFTAVNFISALDDTAFFLARCGKFGPDLRREASRIETMELPPHIASKRFRAWYAAAIVPTALVLLGLTTAIVYYQERSDEWITTDFRVQFQDSTGLELYSGCYHIDTTQRINKRYVYRGNSNNANRSSFGYCLEKRRWLFYEEDVIDSDPCKAEETELAHSSKTTSFDVSTSFLEDWFSYFNTPLEMYFVRESSPELVLQNCGSFVNDGVCNEDFNNFFYQYDGGDCCGPTCVGASCGWQRDDDPRSVWFPVCADPRMVELGVLILSVTKVRNTSWYADTISSLESWEDFRTPFVELDCGGSTILATPVAEQSMAGTTLPAHVDPETLASGNCTLATKHTDLLWTVDVIIVDRDGARVRGDTVSRSQDNRIPKKIGDLSMQTGLRKIDLSDNGFTGTLPSEIGANRNLTSLVLDHNSLVGNLPTELARLESLQELSLRSNHFGGTLPWELSFRWTKLTKLDLEDNAFTGTIPTEIALMTSLTHLSLANNSLFGLLPIELAALTNLRILRLGNNSFFGTLPEGLLRSLTQLETLDLGYNALTGTLPVGELMLLTNLRDFSAPANAFDGTLPPKDEFGFGFALAATLELLDLGQNALEGPLPTMTLVSLTSLKHLDLGSNRFSGDDVGGASLLDGILVSLEKLTHLDLSWNVLGEIRLPGSEALPRPLQNLEYLDLQSIGLVGQIPTEVGSALPSLRHLVLDENNLTGPIPTELGMLQDLEYLGLDGNRLKGTIPSEIGRLSNLSILDIGQNNLIGTLPTELGTLSDSLSEMWLYYNNLEGTIPCALEALSHLTAINLNFNSLTGVIPSGLISSNAGYVHAATQREAHLLVSANDYCGSPNDDDSFSSTIPPIDGEPLQPPTEGVAIQVKPIILPQPSESPTGLQPPTEGVTMEEKPIILPQPSESPTGFR